MKHIVELKYTNPSHEHVSLRRRVETINRVVEAQSADEAINRAANQQRALGFRIQSANIVEQKEEPTTELISEQVVLEAERDAGYKMPAHVAAAQKKFDAQAKGQNKMRPQAGTLAAAKMKKEETEAVEEGAKDWKRAFGAVATKNLNKDVGPMRSKVSRLKYVGMKPKVDMSQKVTAKEVKRGPLHSEAADPGSVRVVNKKVKAAEKMINAAKGKANKVDLQPTLDLEKHKD